MRLKVTFLSFIGKLGCQDSFEDTIPFTEKPYCELEKVRIIEVDLHRDPLNTYES
ncbi:MAG: hypothetical protein MUO60_01000 [Clostridiaceae bacterium]|nr:hypothetical protein [Clostridiaceae bacterium]